MRYGFLWSGLLACAVIGPAWAEGRVRMPDGEVMLTNYPIDALKAGQQGAVGFRIRLDRYARIKTCTVTRSSGYASLDAATCTLLIANARLKPFRSEAGARVQQDANGEIAWTLPPERVPEASPPLSTPIQIAEAGATITCRDQMRKGSLTIRERICLSGRDWMRQIGYAQGETRMMQSEGGGVVIY